MRPPAGAFSVKAPRGPSFVAPGPPAKIFLSAGFFVLRRAVPERPSKSPGAFFPFAPVHRGRGAEKISRALGEGGISQGAWGEKGLEILDLSGTMEPERRRFFF